MSQYPERNLMCQLVHCFWIKIPSQDNFCLSTSRTVSVLLKVHPLSVFMSSSPPTGISLLISLLNLFHSRVSDTSTWLRKENERGTRYRESAESPLWQNNLYTLTSPFIYLKASALTVCWIAVPVLISSADWMTAGCLACCTRFKAI